MIYATNPYAYLPFLAFLANLSLAAYVLSRNRKGELNLLFSLFVLSLAVWALTDFLWLSQMQPTSPTLVEILSIIGPTLMPVFLLHFMLKFTKTEFKRPRIQKLVPWVFYLPAASVVTVTSLSFLTIPRLVSFWSESILLEPIYSFVALYATAYVVTSLIICHRFYKKTESERDRTHARLVMIALLVPTVAGIIFEVLLPFLGIDYIPVTTTLTTFTALTIGYAVIKHRFMSPTFISIRWKMAAAFLVVILTVGPASLLIAYTIAEESTQNEVMNHLQSIADLRAAQITDRLDNHKHNIQHLSYSQNFADLLYSDGWNQTEYETLLAEVYQKMNETMSEHGEFFTLTLLDKEGKIVASTNQSSVGDRSGVNTTLLQTNGSYIKGIYLSEGTNMPAIDFVYPIFNSNGEFVGGLVAEVDATSLYDVLTNPKGMGETGETFLVNDTYVMISPSRFYNYSYNLNNLLFKRDITTRNVIDCFENKGNSSMEKEGWKEEPFQSYRGVWVVGVHSYIAEANWALVVEKEAGEAYASITFLGGMFLLLLILMTVVGLAVSAKISKSISRPIVQLTDVTRRIAKGNLGPWTHVRSTDEIGELSLALTRMTEDLRESRKKLQEHSRRLEKMVEERTRELRAKKEELDDKIKKLEKSEAASLNIMEDLNEALAEMKRAERRIRHQNLLLKAIRDVNQLIAREKDRRNLIKGACSTLVKNRGYKGAWIALFDENRNPMDTAEAGFGDSAQLLEKRLRNGEALHCDRLLEEQQGVVVIESPSSVCGECPLATAHPGSAVMVTELRSGWKILGRMCVASTPETFIDEEELSLFEEVAMDISFALYSIEVEEKHRKASEALKISESRYRLLAENVADVIWTLDMVGRFTYVSPSIKNLLGYTPEEVTNMTWQDLMGSEDIPAIASFLEELSRSGDSGINGAKRSKNIETRMRKKDGSWVWTESEVTFLRNQRGEIESLLGVTRDISERRKIIMDLRRANRELKAAQNHLIQSEKLASIGTLASGIAHEINNPLATIIGYVEAMKEEDDDNLKEMYADKILNAAERASSVVRWLSKHSRASGRESISDININDVLENSLESVKLVRSSPDIELDVHYGDLSPIRADEGELQQVFVNLISNATDAMPKGGHLTIRTDMDGDDVRIQISDTGEGIPEENLHKIFDPFFTTKESGKGTGLGLYIVSMIVMKYNGKITVESKEGEGTTFVLTFPVERHNVERREEASSVCEG